MDKTKSEVLKSLFHKNEKSEKFNFKWALLLSMATVACKWNWWPPDPPAKNKGTGQSAGKTLFQSGWPNSQEDTLASYVVG